VLRHVEVKDTPMIMRNNEETIQQAKVQHWHGEEIHRSNGFTMVAQKGRPSLSLLRTARSLAHPTQYRTLRQIEAKHFQFSMNARRCAAPKYQQAFESSI
jgi:hypothetical protein